MGGEEKLIMYFVWPYVPVSMLQYRNLSAEVAGIKIKLNVNQAESACIAIIMCIQEIERERGNYGYMKQ